MNVARAARRQGSARRPAGGRQSSDFAQITCWLTVGPLHRRPGVMANMAAESGFAASKVGDDGTSVGLLQWHNDRADAMANWARANGKDPAALLSTQLAYG